MDLELDDLACRRAGRTVFRGLSFRLPAGTVAELRGPNGVGKSSLLRLLAGFVPVADGDARLGGVSRAKSPGRFQDHVAYAGHLDAVKPSLTVEENIAHWAAILNAAPGRAGAALERFGLGRIAERPAAECSAGQSRRLGLARLCLTDRPLWLLDEPTASLDADASATVADLIADHLQSGGSALVATHIDLGLKDPPEILRLAPITEDARVEGDPFLEGAW